MQESRLFKILYYLLSKGHATAPYLAQELEVSCAPSTGTLMP